MADVGVVIWPGIGEPLVGLKDRDSCDSSGSVWSLKVETCLLFWLCGISASSHGWDESIAIQVDKLEVSASDEKVDDDCRSS